MVAPKGITEKMKNLARKIWNIIAGLLTIIVFACTSGCTALPYNPADMTAEQLTAAAKDKNASVVCAIGNTPYGRAVIVTVNLDQKVIVQGTVTVDDTCKTTITNAPVTK